MPALVRNRRWRPEGPAAASRDTWWCGLSSHIRRDTRTGARWVRRWTVAGRFRVVAREARTMITIRPLARHRVGLPSACSSASPRHRRSALPCRGPPAACPGLPSSPAARRGGAAAVAGRPAQRPRATCRRRRPAGHRRPVRHRPERPGPRGGQRGPSAARAALDLPGGPRRRLRHGAGADGPGQLALLILDAHALGADLGASAAPTWSPASWPPSRRPGPTPGSSDGARIPTTTAPTSRAWPWPPWPPPA